MNSPDGETASAVSHLESEIGERRRVMWVFGLWCLRREAFTKWSYVILLLPFFVAGFYSRIDLRWGWRPRQGPALLETLLGISSLFILAGGVRHASRAVCWEVSRELRDLIRLTGIAPETLLWCQTLCRWWTIGLSVLLILPLAMFARTLGAVNSDQWIAGGCWLVLLAVLTAGFAMIASVSSGHASNAETTAATATFIMMLLYHGIFWGFAAAIGVASWLVNGTFDLPSGSLGGHAVGVALSLAPLTGIYRALTSADTFSPLDPTYWLHFLTGFICLRMATVVMRNRFRVTTRGDEDTSQPLTKSRAAATPALLRPRCSDRPFFWKDVYILGGGRRSQSWWTTISGFALIGVFGSAVYGIPLIIGIILVCIAPCIVAIRFDALLADEFREQTWASLMLLPIDPRVPLLAKIHAAAWERQAILVPVGVAALIASLADANAVLIAATIASFAGVLMIQVSILNHFNSKSYWAGPVVAIFVILLIGFLLSAWINFDRGISFLMTVVTLGIAIMGILWHINWRLRNWTEG